jgi:hypothetical protein
VILAFEELKSRRAIPILKSIEKHPDASYIEDRAKKAIEVLEKEKR